MPTARPFGRTTAWSPRRYELTHVVRGGRGTSGPELAHAAVFEDLLLCGAAASLLLRSASLCLRELLLVLVATAHFSTPPAPALATSSGRCGCIRDPSQPATVLGTLDAGWHQRPHLASVPGH